jgi:hypothetical protein
LEEAADRAIAPWLFDPAAPIAIGPVESQIDVSQVQQALAQVPQVWAVSAVSLVLFSVAEPPTLGGTVWHKLRDTAALTDPAAARLGDVAASTEWSVLTPGYRHRFRVLTTPRVGEAALRRDFRLTGPAEAADQQRIRRMVMPERAGIGNLAIGSELVIVRDPREIGGRAPAFRIRLT